MPCDADSPGPDHAEWSLRWARAHLPKYQAQTPTQPSLVYPGPKDHSLKTLDKILDSSYKVGSFPQKERNDSRFLSFDDIHQDDLSNKNIVYE